MDEHAAFLGHFLKHQDDIRAFIGSIVRDRTNCDDIFQDVAVVLWQKFKDYDASRSFGAWARGIAVNKVLQSLEKSKRLPVLLSPEAIEAILAAFNESEAESGPERLALEGCLKSLPERSQRLIALRYEQSLRLAEIARQIESSLDAVHKTLSRIRGALRRCIEQRIAAGLGDTSLVRAA